jgi:uncharacterized protein YcfJ
MPLVIQAFQAVALAATIQTVTVPVERVEPIIVNEPIAVQVRRCHNVPVYLNVPQIHHASQPQGVLGGVLGAVIGGGLTKGDTKPYGAAIGAIVGMQMAQQSEANLAGTAVSSDPAYYRQHCGLGVENQLKETIRGYQVSYRLDGVEHWVSLDHRPGSHITVRR